MSINVLAGFGFLFWLDFKILADGPLSVTGSGGDPRNQSAAGGRKNMTRAEIATIFPDATDEQISNLLNINGADINKAKSGLDALRNQLSAAQAEAARLKEGPTAEKLQAETDRANGLQQQLDAFKQADTLRQIREKVAGEKKIPVNLLTGETEEACTQQADAILAFAKPGGYPTVQDGGEPTGANGAPKTRDSFAGWFEQKF